MTRTSRKNFKSTKRSYRHSPKNNQTEWLYGILPVQQALLQQKRTIGHLYLKQDSHSSERLLALEHIAKKANVPISWKPRRELDTMFPNVLHQGAILECGPLPYVEESWLTQTDSESGIFVALDQIEDPQNIGAIIRSCGFFNVAGLIVHQEHFPGLTAAVSKTSAGVAESFPVIAVKNLSRFLKEQKKNGFWVVGMDMEAEQSMHSFTLDRALILVVGNEGKGLRPLVRATCDWLVSIPGNPQVESLNVSNAAAIALYQLTLRGSENTRNTE